MLSKLFIAIALVVAPVAPVDSGDLELARFMRSIGDATRGKKVANGASADKIIYVGKSELEFIVVGIEVKPSNGGWGNAPSEAVAILRTRSIMHAKQADPRDIAYSAATGLPLFIMGDDSKSPLMREIAKRNETIMVREFGANAPPGDWHLP